MKPDCLQLLEEQLATLEKLIEACGPNPTCYATRGLDALTHPFSRGNPKCSRWLRNTADTAFSLRVDTLRDATLTEGEECRGGVPVASYRVVSGETYTLCIGGRGVASGSTLPCLTPRPQLETGRLSDRRIALAIVTGYLLQRKSRSRSPPRPEKLAKIILEDQLRAYSSTTLGGLNLRSPPPLRLLWLRAPIPLHAGPVFLAILGCPEDAATGLYHAMTEYTRRAALGDTRAPVCRLMLSGGGLVAFTFQRRPDRVYTEAEKHGCRVERLEMVTRVKLYRPKAATSSTRTRDARQARV